MTEGYQLVEAKRYVEAREVYQKVIAIDSTNRDAYFNLASLDLALNNNEKACQSFYRLYNLGDSEAKNLILQYCGALQYTDVMDINDITEVPRITINGKTKDFFDKTRDEPEIDNRFTSLITKSLKSSELFKGYEGRIFTTFYIDKNGDVKLKIKGKSLTEDQKAELIIIFNSYGEITPAKFHGKDVGVGHFSMPIKF